ncbi:hypothetical protein MJO28_016618 [Puccinia striiformis f. sp. tritici]|uniref:Uncharacterized protein n=2 Tax=Puccinia striiformis TaxID=27350 RepID=A0A2S4UVM1_9BASI|nr:hypothetical protein MJO28_016618 [Puccinia striiformis f. sp. tritici]POW01338.1 hypothetical protein PSTT_12574 [Puccinia striiformis]
MAGQPSSNPLYTLPNLTSIGSTSPASHSLRENGDIQPFNFNSDKSLLGSGCPPNNYTPSLNQASSYIYIRPIKALPRRTLLSNILEQRSSHDQTINQRFRMDWSSFRPNSDLDLPPIILGTDTTAPRRDTRTSNPSSSYLRSASKFGVQQQVIPPHQSSSQDWNSGRSHLGFFKLKTYDGEWPADALEVLRNISWTGDASSHRKTRLIPSMRTTLPGIEEERSTSEDAYQASSPGLRAEINFPEIPEIESDFDVNENFPVLCSASEFIPEPLNRNVEREQMYETQTEGVPDEEGRSGSLDFSDGWTMDQGVVLQEEMVQSGSTYALKRKSSSSYSDDDNQLIDDAEGSFQRDGAPVDLTKRRRIE